MKIKKVRKLRDLIVQIVDDEVFGKKGGQRERLLDECSEVNKKKLTEFASWFEKRSGK